MDVWCRRSVSQKIKDVKPGDQVKVQQKKSTIKTHGIRGLAITQVRLSQVQIQRARNRKEPREYQIHKWKRIQRDQRTYTVQGRKIQKNQIKMLVLGRLEGVFNRKRSNAVLAAPIITGSTAPSTSQLRRSTTVQSLVHVSSEGLFSFPWVWRPFRHRGCSFELALNSYQHS